MYLQAMTMADVKAQILRADASGATARERIQNDEFYIERSLARILRQEDGSLMFNEDDAAQLVELREVLNSCPANTSRLIHDAHDALNESSNAEVTPKGN